MYLVPLTSSPNQRFTSTIPVNGKNKTFKFGLWFNEEANYWSISVYDIDESKLLIDNVPLLVTKGKYFNIFSQFQHLRIGACFIFPTNSEHKSQPGPEDLGSAYFMIWGDNDG